MMQLYEDTTMEMQWFHNALRIMRHINRYDLKAEGIDLNDEQWFHFQSNPYDWFIRSNDADVEIVWRIIVERNERTK